MLDSGFWNVFWIIFHILHCFLNNSRFCQSALMKPMIKTRCYGPTKLKHEWSHFTFVFFCGVLYSVPVLHTRHNCGATLHFIFWFKPFWFWHQLSLVGSKLLRLFCQRCQKLKYFMPQVIPKGKQMGQWWGWGGVICFVFKGAWLESPLYIAWGTSEWPTIAQILSVCMHYILHPTTPF